MSLGRIERIVCPKCGGEDDFAVWLSINTMDYPEVKQKIMSGEIFLFKCPKCGSETNIKYDCLYHQMENHLMIQVANNDESVKKAVEALEKILYDNKVQAFQLLDSDYTFRIVRDNNQLREKIYIFDHGLDDRVIELMKVIIISHLADTEPDLKVSDLLLNINEGAPEKFVLKTEDGQWTSFPFVQKTYDIIKTEILDLFASNDDGKRSYIININWAIDYLSSHSQK